MWVFVSADTPVTGGCGCTCRGFQQLCADTAEGACGLRSPPQLLSANPHVCTSPHVCMSLCLRVSMHTDTSTLAHTHSPSLIPALGWSTPRSSHIDLPPCHHPTHPIPRSGCSPGTAAARGAGGAGQRRGPGAGWGTASCCRPRGRTAPRAPRAHRLRQREGRSHACNGSRGSSGCGQGGRAARGWPPAGRPCAAEPGRAAAVPCPGQRGRERWLSALAVQNHTLHFAPTKRKQANGRRGLRGGRRARARLGSVVLLAVWFVAQDAIDLVDDGRRQLWKDLRGMEAMLGVGILTLVCAGGGCSPPPPHHVRATSPSLPAV